MLALMRDTSKLVALGRSAPVVKNEIKVFSPAGEGLMWFSVSNVPCYDILLLANIICSASGIQETSFDLGGRWMSG
jgi:hypothetical protein